MFDIIGTIYQDKSKLRKAWEKYYKEKGLSATKMLKLVHKKCSQNKVPEGYLLSQLVDLKNSNTQSYCC